VAESYINRKDERYYLFEGKSKTGKPKFFCSKKTTASGVPVVKMPAGYEWREGPADGIVSVRKTRPTRIVPIEREMLAAQVRERAGLTTFLVDVAEDSLVVYLPDRNPDEVAGFFGRFFGSSGANTVAMKDWTMKHVRYSPMLRFVLDDVDARLFTDERWCFRGAIDDWIFVAGPAPLPKQIRNYVPHLGRESFYELM
jgi:hypothetical protein